MLQLKVARVLVPALGTVLLTSPAIGNAQGSVLPGWDLLVTVPSETEFRGQNWEGVPIGTFDFGSGPVSVGLTDTIMRRTATATGIFGDPSAAVVPIEIVALQLKSVSPFDPDGVGPDPIGFYYLSLNSGMVGDPLSNVSIFFSDPSGGTFDNQFSVNWTMRLGPNGPVVAQGIEALELDGVGYWEHNKISPTGGVPLIPGVNYLLNGTDTSEDFHLAFDPFAQPGEPGGHGGIPSGPYAGADDPWLRYLQQAGYEPMKLGVTEGGSGGASVPDAGLTSMLLVSGLAGLALLRRRLC